MNNTYMLKAIKKTTELSLSILDINVVSLTKKRDRNILRPDSMTFIINTQENGVIEVVVTLDEILEN